MTQQVLSPMPQPADHETGVDKSVWIANGLTGVLSDSVVLMVKTQGYHWNITGPMFLPIHEITEKLYTDLFEAIDVIAERIRALGELAPMSVTDMISDARLTEEDTRRSAQGMVEQLISDNETLVRHLREVAAVAARHGDGATEDLMNARMSSHEKAIWMLRSIASS